MTKAFLSHRSEKIFTSKDENLHLDAHQCLLYLAAMANFYDPFSSHQVNDARSRRPEVSEILPTLFVGEYPRVEDVAWLRQEFGISAVFSLQDAEDLAVKGLSLPALVTAYRQHQIEFRRVAVADFDCDSLDKALQNALDTMRSLAHDDHRVFLHCNAGCNRAPTVAIAYLHSHRGMTLHEARDYVKERRPCGPYMEVLYRYFGRPE
jgi:protein-tyrosine phosphatase